MDGCRGKAFVSSNIWMQPKAGIAPDHPFEVRLEAHPCQMQ